MLFPSHNILILPPIVRLYWLSLYYDLSFTTTARHKHALNCLCVYSQTNFIIRVNLDSRWPLLWSSDQSSWLQIQRSRGRFPALPDFVRSLERGPFSLVSTTEELLGRNNSGSGLENREHVRGDPLRWPRDTLYPQKLALTSPTCGGRWVGIFRLRTKATEFVCLFVCLVSRAITLPCTFWNRFLHVRRTHDFKREGIVQLYRRRWRKEQSNMVPCTVIGQHCWTLVNWVCVECFCVRSRFSCRILKRSGI
jgi:hypothetical protein